ncbi:branched-chain amino acid ABC transporter permease [Natronorubrum sp. FCH18a]|uniref:branched-chain amino acid ABC transporter permease n=1 Tax=Natronorubrum sp. FCH18a TaxID=3447018 RepID=UPI003F50F083
MIEEQLIIGSISFDFWLTQLFNGLMLGMIYVLIATGLTIVFGMMGIINFAHGDLLLVGTYVAFATWSATGSVIMGILLAPLIVGLVGAIIERFALRPIYDRDILLQLLITFGIAEFLRGTVMLIWGPRGHNFPVPDWGRAMIDFGVFSYPSYRLVVIVTGAVLLLGVYLMLVRTDLGIIIRAGTMDREMVNALGIDLSKIYLLVFVIGAALAGIAGALIGPIQGATPNLGIELLVPAFVVVVIGGLGSLRGTLVSGILIGELLVIVGVLFPRAAEASIYLAMVLVLLLRPRGLFGQEGMLEE